MHYSALLAWVVFANKPKGKTLKTHYFCWLFFEIRISKWIFLIEDTWISEWIFHMVDTWISEWIFHMVDTWIFEYFPWWTHGYLNISHGGHIRYLNISHGGHMDILIFHMVDTWIFEWIFHMVDTWISEWIFPMVDTWIFEYFTWWTHGYLNISHGGHMDIWIFHMVDTWIFEWIFHMVDTWIFEYFPWTWTTKKPQGNLVIKFTDVFYLKITKGHHVVFMYIPSDLYQITMCYPMTRLGTTGILYYGILQCRSPQGRDLPLCCHELFVIVGDGKMSTTVSWQQQTMDIMTSQRPICDITMVWNIVTS